MSDLPAAPWSPALGRVPSGLFILTASQGTASTGMLVSWVQQCSFEPPQVSVALRRGREVGAWLLPGAAFALNQLAEGQKDLLAHFGRGFTLDQPAFEGVDIELAEDGVPLLRQALGRLLCRVAAVVPAGDHDLLLAEVVGGALLREAPPFVHVRKSGTKY